ncbi:MAG: serine/threonine protein kinase [Deltaproteobacteria bacterium]|nr:MAG: serine/threonine protein kinase [Deltaproteobacteria bacterium]
MLDEGQRIDGRYVVEAMIGQGGLAQVYRVRHAELGNVMALKLLTYQHPLLAERLLLEGRIQAQLRHPNVVGVTDVVRHEGQMGLLMEYVDHFSLEELLDRRGRLHVDVALELFTPILAGVHAAHQAGVLHRDLKPSNILLSRTPQGLVPKVTDFGIAKVVAEGVDSHTREGISLGTPGYMAPEQVLDAKSVDVRTDVFALGAILYELLTGRRAFANNQGEVTARSTLQGTIRPVDDLVQGVPTSVRGAIARALAKDREDRFQDVAAFARDLLVDYPDLSEPFERQLRSPAALLSLDDRGSSAPPSRLAKLSPAVESKAATTTPPPGEPAGSSGRTRRWIVVGLVVFGLAVGAMLTGLWLGLSGVTP